MKCLFWGLLAELWPTWKEIDGLRVGLEQYLHFCWSPANVCETRKDFAQSRSAASSLAIIIDI